MKTAILGGRGLVPLLAVLMTTCGGEAPTGPTRNAKPSSSAPGTASSLTARASWAFEVVRAPASGQSFKLSKQGTKPQPAPKFRFEATSSVDVADGTFTVQFLTASGKACGIGTARGPISFAANVSRTIDIPNDAIVVGPKACAVEGMSCTASQCRFPLTTKRMRLRAGAEDGQSAGEATESREYKWTVPSSPGGGGAPSGGLTCNGTPAPAEVSCGVPTVRCGDGTYRCSVSPLTCGGGFIFCYVCPGPLCP